MSLRYLLSLYGQYAKMDLAWLLRDTRYCLIVIISDMIASLAAISGVFLLAVRFENFSGMSSGEVLFMLSFLLVANGLREVFLAEGNVSHLSRRIGRGQLEHMFIQPLSFPVQLLTGGFIPFTGSSNLICGVFLMHYSLGQLNIATGTGFWFSLCGWLLLSNATLVGVSYLFSTAAFYAPVACEEIASSVFDISASLSSFPLSGMPVMMQASLLTILPTGLLGWFPCLALLGRPPLGLPGWYPLVFCAVLWLAAVTLLRKGLRYYISIGINRYSPNGHRS